MKLALFLTREKVMGRSRLYG